MSNVNINEIGLIVVKIDVKIVRKWIKTLSLRKFRLSKIYGRIGEYKEIRKKKVEIPIME